MPREFTPIRVYDREDKENLVNTNPNGIKCQGVTGGGWRRGKPYRRGKGDVFALVQRLEPGLSFGHVRKRLREFAELSLRLPIFDRSGADITRRSPSPKAALRAAPHRSGTAPPSRLKCSGRGDRIFRIRRRRRRRDDR